MLQQHSFFFKWKIAEKVVLALPRGKMGCTWEKKNKKSFPAVGKQLFNELSPAPDFLLNTSLVHALNKKIIKK